MLDSSKPKIGRLVYKYNGKRPGNAGEDLWLSKLNYEFVDISEVDLDPDLRIDLLLVSIPTVYQMIDLAKLFKRKGINKRKFKVLIGGYGIVNPYILTDYYDYASFGRCQLSANDIVYAAINGSPLPNMQLAGNPLSVVMQQDTLDESESFTGCKYRCKFCQFSHIRRIQGTTGNYVNESLTNGKSPELMFKDLIGLSKKPGRLRAAIDGWSERLRFSFGKKITNDMIVKVGHLGQLASGKTPIVVTLYNICNFPGENASDKAEFVRMVNSIEEPSGRVIIVLQTMPFKPSPLTPMQYSPAGILPSIVDDRQNTIRDTSNLLVKESYTLEGPWTGVRQTLIERANINNYRDMRDIVLRPGIAGRSEHVAKSVIEKYKLRETLGQVDRLPTDRITIGEV